MPKSTPQRKINKSEPVTRTCAGCAPARAVHRGAHQIFSSESARSRSSWWPRRNRSWVSDGRTVAAAAPDVPAESPVLSPADSMKTMVLPPGIGSSSSLSEPMIQEPVAIDWDTSGRMWVIEMPGYMEDMPATTELQPTGRISILEDTNDDGTMDKKTVFLDKLVLPRTLKVLERGALIAEPPNLWLARDTNGDLVADTKELVTGSYGQRRGQRRAQRELAAVGARQLDVHLGRDHASEAQGRRASRCARRCRAASGAPPRTTPAASTATRTPRRCSSTRADPLLRAQSAHDADPRQLRVARHTTTSTPCGRSVRRPASIAGIRTASFGRTRRSPPSRPWARRRSIAAIGCRQSCTATCSSPSRPATWSAGSW